MRYSSTGFFSVYVDASITDMSSIIPPMSITDLMVKGNTLTFTEPGQNLDYRPFPGKSINLSVTGV